MAAEQAVEPAAPIPISVVPPDTGHDCNPLVAPVEASAVAPAVAPKPDAVVGQGHAVAGYVAAPKPHAAGATPDGQQLFAPVPASDVDNIASPPQDVVHPLGAADTNDGEVVD